MVLEIESNDVFLIFVVISTTAPSLGLLIGGYISSKIGGYTGKHAILFVLINSILATIVGIPIPFIKNKLVIMVLFWLMLFFGGSMLPTSTGLMISSIP